MHSFFHPAHGLGYRSHVKRQADQSIVSMIRMVLGMSRNRRARCQAPSETYGGIYPACLRHAIKRDPKCTENGILLNEESLR